MHLLLTDRLCCPRCGPEFGLILLAREMRDRRIIDGELGCSNCREYYPVREGVGDLRIPPREELSEPETGAEEDRASKPESDEAIRLGALLGVSSGPGTLLLFGPAARFAGALTDLISEVEVVGAASSHPGGEEREGLSRVVMGRRIPFFDESLRGVLLSGEEGRTLVEEGVRTVARMGRVVVLGAPEGTRDRLEGAGLSILLEEDQVLVGVKEGPKPVPLTTLRVP